MNDNLSAVIHARYKQVLAKIDNAAARCGRALGSVRLVVVSKSQQLDVVRSAIEAGIPILGENYVEEAVDKISALKESAVEWHMIGHVQSRKADQVAANFTMLHSLDNLKLAGRLNNFCSELKRTLPVLLEFNVSGEQSKFGFPAWEEQHWVDLESELEKILALPCLKVCGLMTMPPYFDNPEQTRPYFRKLCRLQHFLAKRFPESSWTELSMGTSIDFVAAVEEGATFVRVGQAILGPRA